MIAQTRKNYFYLYSCNYRESRSCIFRESRNNQSLNSIENFKIEVASSVLDFNRKGDIFAHPAMATTTSTPFRGEADDVDSLGVINALERTCELESKLRQAIQQTHPLTTSLEWDFSAADKEREALLAIRLV